MALNINFGTSVIALPGKIRELLDNAGAVELKVLIALSDSPDLCRGVDSDETLMALADICGCEKEDISSAIAFWRGAGVLVADGQKSRKSTKNAVEPKADEPEEKATEKAVPASKKVVERRDELPHYTTEELITLLEERREDGQYINECQNIWGKMFNTHETNVILGLVDYLGLDWEYVLTLLMYVKKRQDDKGVKKSLHYVEKMAFSLYDEGVLDLAALNAKLQTFDGLAQSESRLRAMFGIGERAITPREKKFFSTWLYDYNFSMEIIELAYNITVDTKGKLSFPYMNSILADWDAKGLRTVAAIQEEQEKFKTEKSPKKNNGGSFETDDFFKAAVRRSFGDDFEG